MDIDDAQLELGESAAWVAAALVLIAALGGAVVLAEWPLLGVSPDEPEEPHLVEPGEEGTTQLWPYTSRAHAFETRTLGINLIIYGDADDVRWLLTEQSDIEWDDHEVHEGDADAATYSLDRFNFTFDPEADELDDVIGWDDADGSTRYTYYEVDGEGQWADESYQLHAGTYLGSRMHIRAYDEPQGEWTAIQVHDEHWDWFRLRHTVTGISDSQRDVERDFMGSPFVDEVVRMPFENETADSDGWVTGVYLAGIAAPLFGLALLGGGRRLQRDSRRFARRHRREIALGAGLFALYTGIRYAGIAGELFFSSVSPKVIAAPLYLALVAGTPAIAYVLGKESDRTWAFTFVLLGLGVAFVADFVAMGVSVVPLRVVLHRIAVLVAVGLIAVGAASIGSNGDGDRTPLLVGLVGWVLALVAPLFGYL